MTWIVPFLLAVLLASGLGLAYVVWELQLFPSS